MAQRYVQLRDAMTSQLGELTVHRFGRINLSTFNLGRTANGALAGAPAATPSVRRRPARPMTSTGGTGAGR